VGSKALVAIALLFTGCTPTRFERARADVAAAERTLDPPPVDGGEPAPLEVDGSFESYAAAALRRSPALRASFERWRAAAHRIRRAGKLPPLTLSYGAFLRSVEARDAPQRHRIGAGWSFPWPTMTTAEVDAAAAEAAARGRELEAEALELRRQVAEAYWELWLLDRTREVQRDRVEVLRTAAAAARTRIAVSRGDLADAEQIALSLARAEDEIDGLGEAERAGAARLLAAVGAPAGPAARIAPRVVPVGGLPAEESARLVAAALTHPRVEVPSLMAEGAAAMARSARAARAPMFMVELEWMFETGGEPGSAASESAMEPVMVGAGLAIPLSFAADRAAEREAEAVAAAFGADHAAARLRARAAVEEAVAAIRDAHRRIGLYEGTLGPQAAAAFASVLGAYQAGGTSVAALLMAQEALLEVQLDLWRARAAHVVAWARLEEVVGRAVEAAGGGT
jgi:outer membrane protein TolC